MPMRWTVCLLTILLGGCHSVLLFERPAENAQPSIMPLWELYQQCLAITDPTELVLIIDQFERVTLAGAEPPSWIRVWGGHVASQPLRAAVDPHALGAACTSRAVAVMVAAEHLTEARALYQRMLGRYSRRDWAYYVDQANEALISLSDSTPAVVAFRSSSAPSR
jgi:hypothetical protein